MGSNRDMNSLGILPQLESDPNGVVAAIQAQLDELSFFSKRGQVHAKQVEGLYLPVSPGLPTNPQSGHAYFDGSTAGGADVGKIYDGAWKRVGQDPPFCNNRTYNITNTSWAYVGDAISNFFVNKTPAQKTVIILRFAGIVTAPGGVQADVQMNCTPAPSGVTTDGGFSVTATASPWRECLYSATLTSGVAYQFGLQGRTSAGTSTIAGWFEVVYHFPA